MADATRSTFNVCPQSSADLSALFGTFAFEPKQLLKRQKKIVEWAENLALEVYCGRNIGLSDFDSDDYSFRAFCLTFDIQVNVFVMHFWCACFPKEVRSWLIPGAEMQNAISLVNDLENALKGGTSERRVDMLRRVTDLFLNESEKLNDKQIALFDDVLVHLVEQINTKALVEISRSLASISNAPIEIVRRLARDDEISVAGPILSESIRLSDDDLAEIAKTKGQEHLLAIAGRSSIAEAVTDVLVRHGNRRVLHRLATNPGASFSECGFDCLAKEASQDASLAEKLAIRIDFPPKVLRQLLERATEVVRSQIFAGAAPENRSQIQEMLASIADEVEKVATRPRDYRSSEDLVKQLNRRGRLNEEVLARFANAKKYEETIATLALFCAAPIHCIERLMKNVSPEGLLVACKAAKLNWSTVLKILKMRFSQHAISEQEVDGAKKVFLALSQAAAQRAFRFMRVQKAARNAH